MTTEDQELRHPIPPNKDGVYLDQFWSAMYATAISNFQNETRLIWARYTAFAVVHGVIFGFVNSAYRAENISLINPFLVSGVVGLVICTIWMIINFCGWRAQNDLLRRAWRFGFTKLDNIELLSDDFGGARTLAPFGPIYWSAQSLPFAFGIIDCIWFYIGLGNYVSNTCYRLALVASVAVICLATIALVWTMVHKYSLR